MLPLLTLPQVTEELTCRISVPIKKKHWQKLAFQPQTSLMNSGIEETAPFYKHNSVSSLLEKSDECSS